MRTLLCPSMVVLAVTACGGPPLAALAQASDDATSVSSALSASASLYFRDDYTVTQSAALMVGGEARIEYDSRRVRGCLGTLNDGSPAWSVTAHVKLPSGAQKALTVAGHFAGGTAPAVVPLDSAGRLEIWFETTNRWGCQEWDSSWGANYLFEVFSPAVIHFKTDRSVSVEGSLVGARAVALDYPLERLPNCRQTYSGLPSWEILSFARFDGSAQFSATTTRIDNASGRVASYAVYAVPEGASSLEVWFLNSDRAGCSEWDSDFGRNYRFELR